MTPAHFELWCDYMKLYDFVNSLTDPEHYGLAVSDEVRREALKLTKPEARQPAVPEPKPYEQNYGSVYCQVQRDELERNNK